MMTQHGERRSIASYSLILIGMFWALFGTSATISHGSSGSDSPIVLIFQVLIPQAGSTVVRADFTWNLVGILLVFLGFLSYRYTREKIGPHTAIKRAAVIGTSMLFFAGLLWLDQSLYFHNEYCYTTWPAIIGVECGNILTFLALPYFTLGIIGAPIGSIGFAFATLSTIRITIHSP
jgi:hypothetical protein